MVRPGVYANWKGQDIGPFEDHQAAHMAISTVKNIIEAENAKLREFVAFFVENVGTATRNELYERARKALEETDEL